MVKTDVHLPNKSQMSPSASAAITPHPVPSLPPSLSGYFLSFPVTWRLHGQSTLHRSVDPANMQLSASVGLSGGNLHIFYHQGGSKLLN